MNEYEKTKRNLEIIVKKGDLFDAISLKENKALPKHSFFKAHVFLFSRLLYGVILLEEKIKSFLAPVEKIKKAQEQIRKSLGVPIDIVRSKKNPEFAWENSNFLSFSFYTPYLSILYENEGISIDEYLENLKKIYHFCELYNITQVILKKKDIIHAFPNLVEDFFFRENQENISSILCSCGIVNFDLDFKNMQNYLGFNYNICEELKEEVIFCDLKFLEFLIKRLESSKINKETLLEFRERIEDCTIQNAISTFLTKPDLEKLKRVVHHRLDLALNSDSSYKDKNYGTLYETIKIKGEYIQILTSNKKGKVLNNKVISLYDYFGVTDYKGILKKNSFEKENKEILFISALHLYLCGSSKINVSSVKNNNFISLYDYFYKALCAKQEGVIKKIPGLYTLGERILNKYTYIFNTVTYTCIFICVFSVCEFLLSIAQKGEPNVLGSLQGDIIDFYEKSWNLEEELLLDIKSIINEGFSFLPNETTKKNQEIEDSETNPFSKSGNTGDVESITDEVFATVVSLQEDTIMPAYFGVSYAFTGNYNDGNMTYNMECPFFPIRVQDIEPIFEIKHAIEKEDLDSTLFFNSIELHKTIYPLGDDYALASITITDALDPTKTFVWDYDRENESVFLTEVEVELLKSIEEPEICYTYGIMKGNNNVFVYSMHKYSSYKNADEREIRKAIINGLGLKNDATLEEIFTAIQNKKYSKTPISDARLTGKMESLNEIEYFETIASLDSLVCNLATTLAVGTEDELIYVSGYLNVDDEYISTGEAHAWAMNKEGEIIDLTPTDLAVKEQIRQFIEEILNWSIKYHLPFYGVLLLVSDILVKKFGKRVIYQFKIKRLEKLLKKPNIENSYAKLMETLYGGINVPRKRNSCEFVETITKDFSGFTKEELKELKKELEENKINNNPELTSTLKLVDQIPFMIENQEALKRILK